jgi:hypothetical protein
MGLGRTGDANTAAKIMTPTGNWSWSDIPFQAFVAEGWQ